MKAQISSEFIAYAAILLVIMSFAVYFAVVTSSDLQVESVNTDAKRLAAQMASEINTAVSVGDGYSRSFSVPDYLYGNTDYTMVVMQQRVYIFWNQRSYSLPVLAGNVTGSPVKGQNHISNTGGVIFFG
jgi:uncharacterized protein (UPF0333 family)